MNWILLNNIQQLTKIKELSKFRGQVIFKHSTRCSTSRMSKRRLEKTTQPADIDFYSLDLLHFSSLSDTIASDFGVYHESPQVLLIKNSICIYDESHGGIRMDEIAEQVK